MPLGMEMGLGPGHIVLDGDPAPLPKKGEEAPIFGPFLLWPNIIIIIIIMCKFLVHLLQTCT